MNNHGWERMLCTCGMQINYCGRDCPKQNPDFGQQKGKTAEEILRGKSMGQIDADDEQAIYEAMEEYAQLRVQEAGKIIEELVEFYGWYAGPYDPVLDCINKARKFLSEQPSPTQSKNEKL